LSTVRVTILCTGDIHLGRYPSRVPTGARELSVARVWETIVDRAIELEVDVVALTGDVVDRENCYYEAIGPLEQGVHRLGEAGIETVAVSGNHDFDVLPRLADTMGAQSFRLLGRGGQWDSHTLERDGEPVLKLVGWSFPKEHVHQSPLVDFAEADFADKRSSDVPTVGLMHADLDQPGSRYAPVTTAELETHQTAAWLLGHVHRPQISRTPSDGIILYPGSPQALDPGERGIHGPWLVSVAPGLSAKAEQIPLATVRYEELDVDLSDVDTEDGFKRTVPEHVMKDLRQTSQGAGPLERVVYRLCYRGRTALHRRLLGLSESLLADFEPRFDRVTASVDKVEVFTKPKVDLDEIARGTDPPAVLARLLVELQTVIDSQAIGEAQAGEISEAQKPLFRRLRRQLSDVHVSNAYSPLRSEKRTAESLDDDEIQRLVLAEGMTLLDEMLAQKRLA
jgi:DNA repair exonuclease SbcCD nuclease subunit